MTDKELEMIEFEFMTELITNPLPLPEAIDYLETKAKEDGELSEICKKMAAVLKRKLNKVNIGIVCRNCGRTIYLEVDRKDLDEWNSPDRRHVQDVFPYLTADERELFLSRICGKCFAEMFGVSER